MQKPQIAMPSTLLEAQILTGKTATEVQQVSLSLFVYKVLWLRVGLQKTTCQEVQMRQHGLSWWDTAYLHPVALSAQKRVSRLC